MAAREVPPVGGAAPAPAGEQQGGQKALMEILHWLTIFFLMQNMMALVANFRPPPPPPPSSSDGGLPITDQFMFPDAIKATDTTNKKAKPLGATVPANAGDGAASVGRMKPYKPMCLWQPGTYMDLDVLITDSPNSPSSWPPLTTPDINVVDYSDKGNAGKGIILVEWHERDLILGGVSDSKTKYSSPFFSLFGYSNADQTMNYRNATLVVPIDKSISNNETSGVYAHVMLRRKRASGADSPTDVLVKRMPLTRYRKRKRNRDVKSLLDSRDAEDNLDARKGHDDSVLTLASLNKTHDQILLYMKPSLTLQIIDFGSIEFPNRQSIPRQFMDHMDWYDSDPTRDWYYPILYQSEFWITSASLREVNGTLKDSRLDVNFEPVAMWKWQLQSQTEESWRKQEAITGEEDQGNDVLRNMLLDTNPYLIAVTAIVSILHTVFDVLAFKNDISFFFKNKKSMEGISLRSMIVNASFSLVILLYLADNDTSYMVLMSNGVGLAIEAWKISKAVTVSFEGGKIEWVEASSYKKSKTKEYDEIATSHLLFVTMPLVAGYGMYSLFYQKHKGWYSWVLNTLVGFIYMFGFVMMTPQLFINYKLQSVAHLNWRTMSYKSINTFIDDLFAFVIKMPIMHRLACLRDDLIFFVYLFQRYKYRVDYTRINEFGQCAQPSAEMLAELEREQIIAASAAADVDDNKTERSGRTMVTKRRGAREKKDR
ncbi:hypothetical protein ACHAXA_004218 [Cyclostephanos tholiformis]|uniref:Cleft lip and palate associated transmembrane protein n=1 Tax=Cyclostephanos tholiformis TaxID=382380 RepID=A0ABD3R9G6_9STRA